MRFFRSSGEAFRYLGKENPSGNAEVEKSYPVLVNDYCLDLMDREHLAEDPVAKEFLPDPAELEDASSSFDPLAEEEQMPVPNLIRRFRDRAVLLVTSKCAARCRFCFRKRTWASGGCVLKDIDDDTLGKVREWLTGNPEVREVLVSGGDPLMLPEERLKTILSVLKSVPSMDILRVGTRVPCTAPDLVTDSLAEYFGSVPGLWLAVHFNHPKELTAKAMAACGKFIRAGVPVINQTVLLKGINDDPAVLEELFRGLVRNRIKPHYLFHVDPVRGVRHFATGIETGKEILRAFRPRLSSLAVPTFAIDLPEGGGKVAIQPDYEENGSFPDIHNKKMIFYPDGKKGS